MRIISGIKKGCKLLDFDGDDIRPTTDRVKESVFNLIQDYVSGARVLDVFAGSGALCFEAVSRGAAHGVCIDKSADSAALIKRNREKLGFNELVDVFCTDCKSYIKSTSEVFDIIFMDPPYNKGFIVPVIELIAEKGILSENGIIVVESDNPDKLPEIKSVCEIKKRRYGRTDITVFALNKGDDFN